MFSTVLYWMNQFIRLKSMTKLFEWLSIELGGHILGHKPGSCKHGCPPNYGYEEKWIILCRNDRFESGDFKLQKSDKKEVEIVHAKPL